MAMGCGDGLCRRAAVPRPPRTRACVRRQCVRVEVVTVEMVALDKRVDTAEIRDVIPPLTRVMHTAVPVSGATDQTGVAVVSGAMGETGATVAVAPVDRACAF